MTPVLWILGLLLVAGLVLGAYALAAPKRSAPVPAQAEPGLEPWSASTGWTAQAGEEFAGLSDSARCDLVFAVADLQDERSLRLLEHALDDPSDAVALAAAHALTRRGEAPLLQAYARRHPGERSERIARTLELLD